MASRQLGVKRARAVALASEDLLPAETGHLLRGAAPPWQPEDAIEAYAERVAAALRSTRATGHERGFLAYAPTELGAPLVAEPDTLGGPTELSWRWLRPHATVAFSFHTHPGEDAMCAPSGIDMVGALVRGDHLLYILTTDGRLSGWRFCDAAHQPRAVEAAMHALAQARELRSPFVSFLYDAFEAMRDDMVECVYAARVTADEGGTRLTRCAPTKRFLATWDPTQH